MLDLFTGLVFLLSLLLTLNLRRLSARRRREEAAAQRLAALRDELTAAGAAAAALTLQGSDSIALPQQAELLPALPWLGRPLTTLVRSLHALGWYPTLRQRLVLSGAGALLGSLLLLRMAALPLAWVPLLAPLLWLLVAGWTWRAAMGRRMEALARHLPEAIDAITRIVRSGVPLHSAFGIAADHLRGPLCEELRDLEQWLKLGVPLKQAMQASAARVPLAEYRFFAVILIISQESGGRLGDTLERLSATLRARAELGMKVQAKTSEARASAKIVAALVPGVLLYMYASAPEDFRFLFNDPAGIKVTAYAAASVSLGLLISHLMVRRIR